MDDAKATKDEKVLILEQLRERVSDIIQPHHDDNFLARWLRARGCNIDKAENMFRKNQEWRKKYKMDTILDEYQAPEVLSKYFPGGHCGFDKDGSPVWITPSGSLDIKGLTRSVTQQEIITYNMYMVEKIHRVFQQQTNQTGKLIENAVYIGDGEGLSLMTIFAKGMEVILKMLAIVEANYPEALKQCYVVNAPGYWNIIFNMCKPFLSEDTKKKIVILGRDWKEKLRDIIDPDQLPEHWGGTLRDPNGDPKCPSIVCCGGEVPKEYYKSIEQCVDPSTLKQVTVAAGSKLDLDIMVIEENSILRCVFQTVDCDIEFGVTVQKAGTVEEEVVIKPKRVNSHVIFEENTHECQYIGTYTVHFNNTYSWLTSKQISYLIEVIEPSVQIKRAAQVKQQHLLGDQLS